MKCRLHKIIQEENNLNEIHEESIEVQEEMVKI